MVVSCQLWGWAHVIFANAVFQLHSQFTWIAASPCECKPWRQKEKNRFIFKHGKWIAMFRTKATETGWFFRPQQTADKFTRRSDLPIASCIQASIWFQLANPTLHRIFSIHLDSIGFSVGHLSVMLAIIYSWRVNLVRRLKSSVDTLRTEVIWWSSWFPIRRRNQLERATTEYAVDLLYCVVTVCFSQFR